MTPSYKWPIRDRAIILPGGGREAEKWVKYAPKLSHTPLLIKQNLISTPLSHNDNIKANQVIIAQSLIPMNHDTILLRL